MRILISLLVFLFPFAAGSAEYTVQTYRSVGDRDLQMHIVSPDGHSANARATAVVFFHGGGWRRGSPETGFRYAETLAEHGIVTLAAEYRFTEVATLDEIIADAASAVRWTRERARPAWDSSRKDHRPWPFRRGTPGRFSGRALRS